jgi:hypothetical protein
MNNNKMERLNCEVRDREKVMRGLKSKDTLILSAHLLGFVGLKFKEKTNG